MRVWERVKSEAEKEGFNLDALSKVNDWMYDNRVIACEMNDEFKIIDFGSMNRLCNECQLDCTSCLEKYLSMDAQNKGGE